MERALAEAVELLRAGEVVAFPTETFYGLAIDPWNEAARLRLTTLKGRPQDKSFPLLIRGEVDIKALELRMDDRVRRLITAFWPGALTLVLPANQHLPFAAHDHTVGVRVSSHPLAAALVNAWGGPLTATSANRAAAPPCRSPAEVRRQFGEALVVLEGGPEPTGAQPSTVLRIDQTVTLLREGAVGLAALTEIVDDLLVC